MAQFFMRPSFSERGRLAWVAAAVVLGLAAVVVAFLRGDVTAAIVIALALAAIVGAWLWGRTADGGDDEDDRS